METRWRAVKRAHCLPTTLVVVSLLLGAWPQVVHLGIGVAWASDEAVTVCSFNIKWVGSYKDKENAALAAIVKDCDIVLVQEVVADPKTDAESAAFFKAMGAYFRPVLSPDSTGAAHSSATSTEWFVAFYNPYKVRPAADLPSGFIDAPRIGNAHYDRVPYAFGFRSAGGKLDFVLVSVHLHQGSGTPAQVRRKEEIGQIAAWVNAKDQQEKDFLVVGDTNIQSKAELSADLPAGYVSLNAACQPTSIAGKKPYDQALYRPQYTAQEIDTGFGFRVRDLLTLVPGLTSLLRQPLPTPFEYGPWFDYRFSDHDPVVFRLHASHDDD